jgi:hypothetical protein
MYYEYLSESGRPAVAVFEPHDIVELRRRHFEHIRVDDRDHPVPKTWRDVKRLSGTQLAGGWRFTFGEAFEEEPPRENHDRFVLHAVILERERFARAHVKNLADVAICLGPDQLVAPGLVDDGS